MTSKRTVVDWSKPGLRNPSVNLWGLWVFVYNTVDNSPRDGHLTGLASVEEIGRPSVSGEGGRAAFLFRHIKTTRESEVMATVTKRKMIRDALEDFVVQETKCPVDWDKGIIRGVHIVGLKSKNGGRYPMKALESALELYEGARCNINHPDRAAPSKDRDAGDRFGVFRRPHVRAGGIYADLHFLREHPMAKRVCEAAERMPEAFGFSQNARTVQVADGQGGLIHESILRVRSVDLVCDPATTDSIFESEEDMNDPHTEGLGSPMDEAALDTPTDTPLDTPAEEPAADPLATVLDAIEQKYLPDIRDPKKDKATRKQLATEMAQKIEALIGLLSDKAETTEEDTSGGGTPPGEKKDDEKKDGEGASMESDKFGYEEALDVLESVGVVPNTIRVKALIAAANQDDREALAKSWSGTNPGTPPKPKSSSVLESSKNDPDPKTPAATMFSPEQVALDARRLMSAAR